MTVNNELLNRAIRHAVYLEQIKAKEVARMMQFMDSKLIPDMERLLAKRLKRVGIAGGGIHAKRFSSLMEEMRAILKSNMGGMRGLQADRMLKIGNLEAQWQAGVLKQTVPLEMTFKTPTIGTIRSALTSKPMQGRLLSKWYSDLATSTAKNISDQLTIGFLQGESIDRLSARIMGVPDIEKGFSGTSTRAQVRRHVRTVTRTATNHIASNARDATYAENKDIIKKVRYVATLDSRTSDVCQSLDGQEFPVGQGERPPMHHQCRSTTVPITMSWKELGITGAKDVRLGGRALRDVKTGLSGLSPKEISYGQWLKAQPADVQNQIFGVKQADLLRSGKLQFAQFFDNGRKLSIGELAQIEGITLEGAVPTLEALVAEVAESANVSIGRKFDELNEFLTTAEAEAKELRAIQKQAIKDTRARGEANTKALKEARKELSEGIAEFRFGLPEKSWYGSAVETERLRLQTKLGFKELYKEEKLIEKAWKRLRASEASMEVLEGNAMRREVLRVFSEAEENRAKYSLRLRDKGELMLNDSGTNLIKSRGATRKAEAQAEEATDFVNRIVPKKHFRGKKGKEFYEPNVFIGPKDYRANYQNQAIEYADKSYGSAVPAKSISLKYGEPTAVWVHELSHTLEYASKSVSKATNGLLKQLEKVGKKRYKGNSKMDIEMRTRVENKQIFRGGDPDEVGIFDGFEEHGLHAYWGRVYDGRASTELITMFMETMYRNPRILLDKKNRPLAEYLMNAIKGNPVDPAKLANLMLAETEKTLIKMRGKSYFDQ
tara:strand:+ start:165 stop:2495 length:2331 start_codon:yes stop_codon:yes gene_type:complete